MIEPGVKRGLMVRDGVLISSTVQDCTPIAEYTKARQNAGDVGSSDMKLAASIPFVMLEKYLNDNDITLQTFTRDQGHQKRMLADPALAHFRVWRGAL